MYLVDGSMTVSKIPIKYIDCHLDLRTIVNLDSFDFVYICNSSLFSLFPMILSPMLKQLRQFNTGLLIPTKESRNIHLRFQFYASPPPFSFVLYIFPVFIYIMLPV